MGERGPAGWGALEALVLRDGNTYASFTALSVTGGQVPLDNATDVLNFWMMLLVAQMQYARMLQVGSER